jgi:hypothetical protein
MGYFTTAAFPGKAEAAGLMFSKNKGRHVTFDSLYNHIP